MRLPPEQMSDVHIIRQDYAKAKEAYELDKSLENISALADVADRRARAIRMLHNDDNFSIRILAGIFRCTKETVKEALAAEEDQA